MPVINFTGLATGLDSGTMIDQLVAVERSRETVYQQRISALNRQGTIVDDLTAKLATLRDRVLALDTPVELKTSRIAASDDRHASVAAAGASVGSHSLRVGGLARAQTVSSIGFASSAAGAAGDGSVSITTAGNTVDVSWTAADSLATIAQRITDANAGVTASVVYDGSQYRLVATSRATGTAAASTFVESGAALGWSQPGAIKVAAADASFTLDGIPMTRSKNVVDDALPGVTLTLTNPHAATDPDTTLEITTDRGALTDKLKGVVDAYNAVAGVLDNQLRYDGVKKGSDTLFGDSTLRRLQSSLTQMVTSRHGGKTLAELGASIDRTGRLTLDTTKLDAALTADPDALKTLLVDGGLATKVAGLAEQYTRSGNGILASKGKALDDQVKLYQSDIDRIEDAATRLGDRLRTQFSALEQAVSNMKTQSAKLTAILGNTG